MGSCEKRMDWVSFDIFVNGNGFFKHWCHCLKLQPLHIFHLWSSLSAPHAIFAEQSQKIAILGSVQDQNLDTYIYSYEQKQLDYQKIVLKIVLKLIGSNNSRLKGSKKQEAYIALCSPMQQSLYPISPTEEFNLFMYLPMSKLTISLQLYVHIIIQ